MKKLVAVFIFIILAMIELQAQTCFTKNWTGSGVDQMNFYITKATVNGVNLQIGDEIGIFDGTACVGVGVLTQAPLGGSVFLSMVASKDDATPPAKNGYTPGNAVSYKLCSSGATVVVTHVQPLYTTGAGLFSIGGTAVVELTGTIDIPTAPIVGTITQPTCAVSTGSVALSGLPASGTWTLTRTPGGTTTGAGATTTVSGLPASGTYTFTVTNASGFTSPSSDPVDINAQPVIPGQPGTMSGATPVCQGSSQTYSISAVTGATSYTWTLPSGWSGSSTSTSITATAGATGGTISVTANNSCGSSIARTLSVTVTAVPGQPGTITGATTVCQGAAQTYSISAVTGATSYTWTLPSGWSGSSSSTSITATAGSSGGTISATANNSCGSSASRTLSVSVTATPAQPGAISGLTSVCQGTSNTYSISSVSGATSYNWSLPSGWSGSSSSTSITATAGSSGGTISATANNSCGSSASRTLSVSVTATPAQPGAISGLTSVCQGTSNTYSISSVSGATSYNWSLPSGWSGSSSSISITATAGASGGTISVTANNSCGSGASRTLSVSVTTTPAQPGAISGLTSVCQGTSNTYSISSVSGATSYNWSLPSGWSGSSSSNSITTTAGASGGTISVTANNSCGSGASRTLSVSVTTTPAQPGAISGLTSVCQGTSNTYSISSVSGATSYTWSLPSGWSGSSSSTSITTTAGASGGTISVTANNSCGSSASRTLSVSVTATPAQPGAISGLTSVCQGTSNTYSISSVSGATSYNWSLPSGWSGSSSSISITATAGASGGTISVTANNSCGSGASRTLSVSVTTTPAQPGAISGLTSVCQGTSNTYSISSVSGATSYNWSLPSGWSGSSSSNSITTTAGASGGTISVTANNSCGSSTPRTTSIVMAVKPTVTTSTVSTLSGSTARAGGNITSNGGAEVTVSGVCWSTSPNPTTSNSKTTDGPAIGNFTSIATGLTENETYYMRAYATNCSGTGYGSNIVYNHANAFEVIQSSKISVYPNPVSGILTIEYKNGAYETINIFNSQGVLLASEKVIMPRQQLDFSKYEYGVYILEFVKPGVDKERVRVINH